MVGVTKIQFDLILDLFREYVNTNWSRSGRPSSFGLEDRLLLTFRYLRDYPTFIVLGNEFGISESFSNKIFNKVAKSLVKVLPLPNLTDLQNKLKDSGKVLQKVIIDVSEQRTERPKKNKS
jgi:Helix-turn-helix of DDE superfamily endonuclease